MGWMKVGQIEVYSISRDVSDFTTYLFKIIVDMINPFALLVFILFITTFIFYLLYSISKNIEHTGDV